MRRWPEILLTLVLFAVAMTAVSWVVNATVPGAVDWAADRIGAVAVLAIVGAIIAAAGIYAWRGYRTAGKNPNGT